MFDLTGKNAIITGSSKGIGKSIAAAMAQQGANVVISSRKADVCEATAEEINSMGFPGKAIVIPCNICLLYTSPSPRDQRGSRMPSSA